MVRSHPIPLGRRERAALASRFCDERGSKPDTAEAWADTMALMRYMPLNVFRKDPAKGSPRGRLKRADQKDAYLAIVIAPT